VSRKKEIIAEIFQSCEKSGVFEFDNAKVREICQKAGGFGNPHDVTKVDQCKLLPGEVKEKGYCIVNLGMGKHCFSPVVDVWFHQFEAIEPENEKDWPYKPSLLNNTDSSESNIISLVYNQRIIQDFLYNDIQKQPKIYMSRRTKITESYHAKTEHIRVEKLQVEMDATFECDDTITILEGKNGKPDDFSVYQLFHPFLDYYSKVPNAKNIECCYLIKDRDKEGVIVLLYLYCFRDAGDIASIYLKKNARYNLKMRQ